MFGRVCIDYRASERPRDTARMGKNSFFCATPRRTATRRSHLLGAKRAVRTAKLWNRPQADHPESAYVAEILQELAKREPLARAICPPLFNRLFLLRFSFFFFLSLCFFSRLVLFVHLFLPLCFFSRLVVRHRRVKIEQPMFAVVLGFGVERGGSSWLPDCRTEGNPLWCLTRQMGSTGLDGFSQGPGRGHQVFQKVTGDLCSKKGAPLPSGDASKDIYIYIYMNQNQGRSRVRPRCFLALFLGVRCKRGSAQMDVLECVPSTFLW